MLPPSYLVIPVVTALIGWGTNVLAVRMLFRPRRPRRLLWWRLQGVIPRRKIALAGSVAEVFERELLSNDELVERFQGIELKGQLEPLLDQRIEAFLERMVGKMPMVKMFFNDSLKGSISEQLKLELLAVLPEVQEALGRSLGEEVNLRELIEEKVRGFSTHRMESIIIDVAKRELKAIELLGGLLGLLIGVGQVALMSWLS